jgi:hypothetical protein
MWQPRRIASALRSLLIAGRSADGTFISGPRLRQVAIEFAKAERGEFVAGCFAARPAHIRYSTAKFTIIMPSSCSRLWQWNM